MPSRERARRRTQLRGERNDASMTTGRPTRGRRRRASAPRRRPRSVNFGSYAPVHARSSTCSCGDAEHRLARAIGVDDGRARSLARRAPRSCSCPDAMMPPTATTAGEQRPAIARRARARKSRRASRRGARARARRRVGVAREHRRDLAAHVRAVALVEVDERVEIVVVRRRARSSRGSARARSTRPCAARSIERNATSAHTSAKRKRSLNSMQSMIVATRAKYTCSRRRSPWPSRTRPGRCARASKIAALSRRNAVSDATISRRRPRDMRDRRARLREILFDVALDERRFAETRDAIVRARIRVKRRDARRDRIDFAGGRARRQRAARPRASRRVDAPCEPRT